MDSDDVRDLVKYTIDAIDGDGGGGDDGDQYEKNRLHASPLGERVVVNGDLDKASGEIVMTAVDAMAANLFPTSDGRKASARQADAFVEICRRSLIKDHTRAGRARRGRPHMSTIVDLQVLEHKNPELVADVRAEAAHVGRLSVATLERIACDCAISRIITDGPSQIIDVGRTTTNIPDKLWNALVARDHHCQHPGCDIPPAWCEGHHTHYWTRGGPTNLTNLELLCWRHHREHHRHDTNPRAG